MAPNPPYKICFVPKSREEEEEDEKIYKRCKEIVATTLPTTKGRSGKPIYQYQGFWYDSGVHGVGPLALQEHFKARPSDILLASIPKCGTTCLKSLAFAVMNRKSHPPSVQLQQQHPLHIFNSHDLVPRMEWILYNNNLNGDRISNLDILPSPRLFSTHMPYTSLPQSVALSGSRIVYICRNTKDNLISWWHFINKIRSNNSLEPIKLEEAFEMFCKGKSSLGPFWEHVLGYWKASLERPQNVLFLKYGEMVAEPALHLIRIAEFIGCSFSLMEEKQGVVDQIIKLCSFENLSNLEVNKTGTCGIGIPNNAFFRQGKVGDSANYLTSEMLEQLDQITKQKWHGSGLTL
ncbi:cytosolic sulfotransferase 5-like [Macadamia integrifolia]|uniref:cytosolic sulfotransferase 5-like n=1 Tax=Macadamia integrifolia TaxID=60698 RepID=UPI001C4F93E8|nr:cytosolic sulfotransferase 5-like [Macadamia integrifolia]